MGLLVHFFFSLFFPLHSVSKSEQQQSQPPQHGLSKDNNSDDEPLAKVMRRESRGAGSKSKQQQSQSPRHVLSDDNNSDDEQLKMLMGHKSASSAESKEQPQASGLGAKSLPKPFFPSDIDEDLPADFDEMMDDVTMSFKEVHLRKRKGKQEVSQQQIDEERPIVRSYLFEEISNHHKKYPTVEEMQDDGETVLNRIPFMTSTKNQRIGVDATTDVIALNDFIRHESQLGDMNQYQISIETGAKGWWLQMTHTRFIQVSNSVDAKFRYEYCLLRNDVGRVEWRWAEYDATITRIEYIIWRRRFDRDLSYAEITVPKVQPIFYIDDSKFEWKQKHIWNCKSAICNNGSCNARTVFSVFRHRAGVSTEGKHINA